MIKIGLADHYGDVVPVRVADHVVVPAPLVTERLTAIRGARPGSYRPLQRYEAVSLGSAH